jgi:hypothetical protein
MINTSDLVKKWGSVIDLEGEAPIKDPYKRRDIAVLLENTERELGLAVSHGSRQMLSEAPIPANFMGASSSTAGAGGIDTFDPIMISMVRRNAPNSIAYDILGVQPMTGPSGLVFCLRPTYSTQSGNQTWYNEVDTAFSTVVSGANTFGQKNAGYLPGNNTVSANLAETGLYNTGTGMSTAQGEALGTDSNTAWPEMSFTIDKHTVTAKERNLKGEYTIQIAQDLKAVHGLDADQELSAIISTELLTEINREVIRTVNFTARQGSQENVTTAGFFDLDTDSNGRWSVEKFKGLMFHIDRECNRVAKETRRGKGNIMICTSDIASALQAAGVLDYAPAIQNALSGEVDDTGNTFVGVLNGRIKVFIDPYADAILAGMPGLNYFTVGFKGATPYDAGLFYSPYVPLQRVTAVDPGSFHPKIGYLTRYAMSANPFAQGLAATNQGVILKDSNVFYRRTLVKNIM